MRFVDTNVVPRHLTRDDVDKADARSRLLRLVWSGNGGLILPEGWDKSQ